MGGDGRNSIGSRQEVVLVNRSGASLRGPSVARWVGQTPTAPSGWKRNGSQSGQGAIELGFPGPTLGKMQGEEECRTGEPSGEGEDPPWVGLGGEAARGEMVETHTVLEVSDGVLDLGVTAMVSLQVQGIPVPVGDESVITVGGENRSRCWPAPWVVPWPHLSGPVPPFPARRWQAPPPLAARPSLSRAVSASPAPTRSTSASSIQPPPARACPCEKGGWRPPASSAYRQRGLGRERVPGPGAGQPGEESPGAGPGWQAGQTGIGRPEVAVEGDADSVGVVK